MRAPLTPSDLGHRFSEHLVQQCYEKAGHKDAEKLMNLMMAAAICDHNELHLDKPPPVEDQLEYARLSFSSCSSSLSMTTSPAR